ncbi:toxin glutamine deamidase domain-containing protein [Nocardia sp. NPDC088792]|uniref:toxin glutamine deamidase domain-containing protein n=1 Tax=Nocardia sp. NPDC088792 TaxID=3364332 RepID=UPI003820DA0E
MYELPGEGDPGVPSAKVPKTLEELAIPGYQAPSPPVNPVIQEMISPGPTSPAADSGPKSLFPGVPGLEDQVGIPRPVEVQATASCGLPTLVVPGVVPDSITRPDIRLIPKPGYTAQQLNDDIKAYYQGRVPWVGPVNPYDAARARLLAAQYTPLEQRNDLEWAFYEPKNDDDRADQQAAFRRLHDAGIRWRDPAVEKYLHDDKTQWLIDPTQPATNAAPPRFSPAEIRRQIIDMNRPDVDPKTFLNDALVEMTIGPAMVLWDAAHDRGDHSGWEITMAAAQLGLDVLMIPGVGSAAARGAGLGLRKIAPEFMASLEATDTAADALRISRQFQDQQLLKQIDTYGQRTGLPPTHIAPPLEPAPTGLNVAPNVVAKPPELVAPSADSILARPLPEVPPTSPIASATHGSVEAEIAVATSFGPAKATIVTPRPQELGVGLNHGVPDTGLAGAISIRDIATPVPSRISDPNSLAIHSESAGEKVLSLLFNREYSNLIAVNSKNFHLGLPGYDLNCTRCVVAADRTLAGTPSVAEPLKSMDKTTYVSKELGGVWREMSSYRQIVRYMNQWGPGSRGVVFIERVNRGRGAITGHVFNVVHDKNGIVFLDAQNAKFARLENFKKLHFLRTN